MNLMHIILSFGIGLAIWLGSVLILNGTITSGSFVSFLTALIMLYTPMKSIGSNYNAILMSFLAIERVFNIMDSVPQIQEKKDAKPLTKTPQKIEFNNVSFEYKPNVPVLRSVNLTINRGETIAIVGNSGGGKGQ